MYTFNFNRSASTTFCLFLGSLALLSVTVAAQRTAHGAATSTAKGSAGAHTSRPTTHTSRGRLVNPATQSASSPLPLGTLPGNVLAARRLAPLVATLPRARTLPLLSGYWLSTLATDTTNAGYAEPSYIPEPAQPRAAHTTASEPSSVQPLGLALPQASSSLAGTLQLDVEPRSAQLYVDGFAAGGVDDINAKGGLRLAAGWHRLEFRARGYETPAVNVTVEPNQTMTYHLALRPNVQ